MAGPLLERSADPPGPAGGHLGGTVVGKKAKNGVTVLLPHILKAFKAFSAKGDLLPALRNAGSRFP